MVPAEMKLEMPKEWYLNCQTKDFPPPNEKKKLPIMEMVQMVQKRIQMLMAKTLLVYNRLKAFYK
jgi:hypothetical protein